MISRRWFQNIPFGSTAGGQNADTGDFVRWLLRTRNRRPEGCRRKRGEKGAALHSITRPKCYGLPSRRKSAKRAVRQPPYSAALRTAAGPVGKNRSSTWPGP